MRRTNSPLFDHAKYLKSYFDCCTRKYLLLATQTTPRGSLKQLVSGNAKIQKSQKSCALDPRRDIITPFFE